ncbi:MDR/zinc-dependent alcohol dehydrogenase-like family protein [Pelotomaculum propionicicum]|uniref:2-deoxy-scyllo-inosamine dehydrogenase n=1 Tax=Pelotomaculum propionicicum TaxID=258475 RepID=A0A4Y7RM73_9FIRM|nr:alcohol dehydrogenase catalytic domain-containing protein [Pelotomaculum propionicicum]TEB09921.1 2-deoxy-scyllo-inosamine dehydrogenase [Pelotomaculum propionicicum]
MKCLFYDGNLKLIEDYAKPISAANEVLIRVSLAGICNTDIEIMKGYKGFKGILGHEFVGIVEYSPVPELIGKRVVGDINIGCGECALCIGGHHKHCGNRRVLGILGKDGAFGEYITLPVQNLHTVPDNVSDFEAVFAEPLAAALEITEKYHVKPTDKVAVVGDGKLGQLVAQVLSLTGCNLTVIGKHVEKLQLLKDMAITANLSEANFHRRFDLVVECAGNPEGLKYAQQIVKPAGAIILKSTYHGSVTTEPANWVVNEITLMGSRCGPMDAALRLLERKLVSVENLVSGVYRLEDWEKAFEAPGCLKTFFKII